MAQRITVALKDGTKYVLQELDGMEQIKAQAFVGTAVLNMFTIIALCSIREKHDAAGVVQPVVFPQTTTALEALARGFTSGVALLALQNAYQEAFGDDPTEGVEKNG